MREATSDIGKVTYPEEICFAFNPNRVTVETNKAVTLYIDRIDDVREPMNGKVEIDLSKYLQSLVSKDKRHWNQTIMLVTEDGTFTFYLRIVWGAINIGDTFNDEYTLRWWKGLPFTMEMWLASDAASVRSRYDKNLHTPLELSAGWVSIDPMEKWPQATDKVVVRVDDGDTASVFDYTFDNTFTGVDRSKVHLYRLKVEEVRECGVYLRWIDRHGWLRYWLFDEGQETTASKALDAVKSVHVGKHEYVVSRYIGKQAGKSVKLCAPSVTDEEYAMLEQIATSPVVDMWTGSEWIPVNIEALSVTRGGKDWKPLNDFECVMSYPEVVAQRL